VTRCAIPSARPICRRRLDPIELTSDAGIAAVLARGVGYDLIDALADAMHDRRRTPVHSVREILSQRLHLMMAGFHHGDEATGRPITSGRRKQFRCALSIVGGGSCSGFFCFWKNDSEPKESTRSRDGNSANAAKVSSSSLLSLVPTRLLPLGSRSRRDRREPASGASRNGPSLAGGEPDKQGEAGEGLNDLHGRQLYRRNGIRQRRVGLVRSYRTISVQPPSSAWLRRQASRNRRPSSPSSAVG